MSGPQAKPFKARLGIDANNEKVINVKDPTDATDAINVQYLVAKNTVQTFDPTRAYPIGFIVERSDRLYKAKAAIVAGAFDLNAWSEIHAFNLWQRVAGSYQAEPGDCLLLNTASSQVTITLPAIAEEGDCVFIMDEGTAAINPINLAAGTNTFNNTGVSTYSINSSDTTQVVFLGGTWRVNRVTKPQYQLVTTSQAVVPNSWNYVQTAAAPITVILPINPIQGQWITVTDGSVNASTYNITINGNGKNIAGASSYLINRSGTIVTLIYDQASGEWKANAVTQQGRKAETLAPLPNQSVVVTLDGTNKVLNLPNTTGLVDGDWVEVVARFQDSVATGSLVVTATGAGFFRTDGASQNTTTFRIKQRVKALFLFKGNEWSVITTNDTKAVPAISTGTLIANTFVNVTGASGQVILLPQADQVRLGDLVTIVVNSAAFPVVIGLQSTSTGLLDGGTANLTYNAANTGLIVTFVYRGWNGSKYVWESIVHGTTYMKKTSNLADLADIPTARTTLSVYSKAEADAKFLGLYGTTAEKSLDTERVGGVPAAQMAQNTSADPGSVNPDTTALNLIVTNHANTPNNGATYWYVNTVWAATITSISARFQTAMQYNGTPSVKFRQYNPAGASGVWTDWISVSTITDGSTYPINVTGLAGTASKLNIARSINGVPFDGTANITVADATKLPLTGGVLTGPIVRNGTGVKTYDQVLNKAVSGAASVTGTLKITLPVSFNDTMMQLRCNIFDYAANRSNTELLLAGYNYAATPSWVNVAATTNGNLTNTIGQSVRFAFDGTKACILIGTTASVWAYPTISINDVQLSYTGSTATGWDTGGWDATLLTSETGLTVTATAVIDQNVAKLDKAVNLFAGTVQSNAMDSFRQAVGSYGTFWRNDGSSLYLMQTAAGDPYGTFNSYRPLSMNLANGAITSASTWSFSSNVTVNGNFTATGTSTFSGAQNFSGTTIHNGWWRSSGATGWYNQDFGGGINMQDTTWVRVYGSKGFLVTSDIAATGNVIAYYSDKRLKENLKQITNAMDTVRAWTGYTYNANALGASFGYDPTKQEIGLLAQDVQATTPQAVEQAPFDVSGVKGESLTGENYLTLKYERLVPVLVEALKEQDKEIQALKQQVAALIAAISK
jgi:hypothetical protein